ALKRPKQAALPEQAACDAPDFTPPGRFLTKILRDAIFYDYNLPSCERTGLTSRSTFSRKRNKESAKFFVVLRAHFKTCVIVSFLPSSTWPGSSVGRAED